MSEPAAKPRPMIDLDEFERRLRRPAAAAHPHEDPLAELARLVGGHEDPFKTVFDQDRRLPRAPRLAPVPPASTQMPGEPHFDDEFAPEEPYLHGTIHPQAYGAEELAPAVAHSGYAQPEQAPEPVQAEGYDWAEAREPVTPLAADPPRSRRPLFVMAAIIVAGITGIGVSFAYKSKSGPHELATIKAMTGPTKVQPDSPGGTDVPNQDASILDKSAQPTPVGLSDHNERPVDLALQQGAALPRTLMADAGGSMGAASVPVPVPPAGAAQQNIQSYGIGALIEPKKVKTVSVRSDGTLLPNDTPPQMPAGAAPGTAAPNTHGAAAATPKPATPKSTARVVTTPKPPQSIEQLSENTDAAPSAPAPAKPKVVAAKPIKVAEAEATEPASESRDIGAGGGFAVQFAAPGTEQEAHEMTAKLAQKFGGELSGHHLTYHRAKVGEKTVFRVRTSGLSREEATGICQKVQTSGGSCYVAKD